MAYETGINIRIDSSGAKAGAQEVVKSLGNISDEAKKAVNQVKQLDDAWQRDMEAAMRGSKAVGEWSRETAEAANTAQRASSAINQAAQSTQHYQAQVGQAASATSAFGTILANVAAGALAGFIAALSARQIGDFILSVAKAGDQVAVFKARMAAATGDIDSATASFDKLYRVAQNIGAPLENSVRLFSRLSLVAGELGRTSSDLVRFTDLLQKSFVIGGSTTTESSSAALQISQALGSGRLQGDEFRAVMENAGVAAKAIADHLGVSVGELKEMSKDGNILANDVLEAVLKKAKDIDKQFGLMPETVDRAWARLQNALLLRLDDLNKKFMASPILRFLIGQLTTEITPPAQRSVEDQLKEIDKQIEEQRKYAKPGVEPGTRGAVGDALLQLQIRRMDVEQGNTYQNAVENVDAYYNAARKAFENDRKLTEDARQAHDALVLSIDKVAKAEQQRVERMRDALTAFERGITTEKEYAAEKKRINELYQEESGKAAAAAKAAKEHAEAIDIQRREMERVAKAGADEIKMINERIAAQAKFASIADDFREEAKAILAGKDAFEEYARKVAIAKVETEALRDAVKAFPNDLQRQQREVAERVSAFTELLDARKVAQAREDAEKAARQIAEAQLKQMEKAIEHSTDRVVDFAADAFDRILSGGVRTWRDLADELVSAMRKAFAQIAAEALVRPIVQPIIAQAVTSFPGLFDLNQSKGTLQLVKNSSGSYDIVEAAGAADKITSAFGPNSFLGKIAGGADSLFGLGGFGAGAGETFAAASAIAPELAGGAAGIAGTAGSAGFSFSGALAAIAPYAPYIAAAAIAIPILSSIFGKKSVGPVEGGFATFSGGLFAGSGAAVDNGGSISTATGFQNQLAQGLNALLRATGGSFTEGFRFGIGTNPTEGFNYNLESLAGQVDVKGFGSFDEALIAGIKAAVERGDFTPVGDAVVAAITKSAATSLQEFDADIQFGRLYDRAFLPLSQVAQSLDAIAAQEDEWSAKANQLGLALDPVTTAIDRQIRSLAEQAGGIEAMSGALDELGLSGTSFGDRVLEAAQAVQKAADEVAKANQAWEGLARQAAQIQASFGSQIEASNQNFAASRAVVTGGMGAEYSTPNENAYYTEIGNLDPGRRHAFELFANSITISGGPAREAAFGSLLEQLRSLPAIQSQGYRPAQATGGRVGGVGNVDMREVFGRDLANVTRNPFASGDYALGASNGAFNVLHFADRLDLQRQLIQLLGSGEYGGITSAAFRPAVAAGIFSTGFRTEPEVTGGVQVASGRGSALRELYDAYTRGSLPRDIQALVNTNPGLFERVVGTPYDTLNGEPVYDPKTGRLQTNNATMFALEGARAQAAAIGLNLTNASLESPEARQLSLAVRRDIQRRIEQQRAIGSVYDGSFNSERIFADSLLTPDSRRLINLSGDVSGTSTRFGGGGLGDPISGSIISFNQDTNRNFTDLIEEVRGLRAEVASLKLSVRTQGAAGRIQ